MGTSPLLGTDPVPTAPDGRDTGALGPSDTSDSGSDMAGIRTGGEPALPLEEVLQEAAQPGIAPDIDADRVVTPHDDAEGSGRTKDDEDADLAFVDRAQAGDPLEDEPSDPDPREPGPNPEPDAPAPTEPSDPAAPPAEPDDGAHRRPGRLAALLRKP